MIEQRVTRRVRGRLRLSAHVYAHRFLGVRRYPPGVRELVDRWVNDQETVPSQYGSRELKAMLAPYRKRSFLA